MTTIAADRSGQSSEVADAARDSWRASGHDAAVVTWRDLADRLGVISEAPIALTVVVPKAMRIECVLEEAAPLPDAWEAISTLRSEGWLVNILLPIRAMGRAHDALRGLDVALQGWWLNEQSLLRFTAPEIP